MRHKRLTLSALLLLGIGLTGLQAQTAVPASGGKAKGTGGSVSYSVGQVVYTTNSGANGSVAQGVQQPFEISVIKGIKESITFSAYPNPTTDFITLEVKEFELSNFHFQMNDINGKILQSGKIVGSKTKIFMRNLVPATYFVRVTESNQQIKTFKIIKN
jgi:hypothetical protein